ATLRKKLKAEQEARLKAEQEANEKKMWYLAITFLIGLAILAVFFIKGKHQSSNDPSNSQKSGVENLKNPSHKN
ncbi:flagellar biosynthesis protein FlgG, partial [Helicobacter pylori]